MPKLLLSNCQIWWRYFKPRPCYYRWNISVQRFDLERWPWHLKS